jgi:SAM-dependent methyltransferase
VTDSASREEIAAASAYEDLHVPALFRGWAGRVADAAQIRPGHRVLDVACGTGILTREVASRVGQQGSVMGLDSNPGMLAVAKRLAPAIEWRKGTAEDLPFEDGEFDAVVSQFGLMFFTDRCRALGEMLRVLAPSGRLTVAVWDSLANSPVYSTLVALLERIAGAQAADALRAPFVLGDRDGLAKLLRGAGVSWLETATHCETARFPSLRIMVEAELRGWLPIMGVDLAEDQIQHVLREAEHELGRYLTPQGEVVFDSPAHIASGTPS